MAVSTALASLLAMGGIVSAHAESGPPRLSTNPGDHIFYPSKGQTAEQQEQDQLDAYNWATEQTGWDPYRAVGGVVQKDDEAKQVEQATKGKAVGGALRGAILGVAIGAIAGDAGKGAAIGATAGGLTGGMQTRQARGAAKDATSAATIEYQQKFQAWDRHFVAAMEGKGYVVK